MRNTMLALAVALVFVMSHTAVGQTTTPVTPLDPYRSFVGSWTGTIPVNSETMPKSVKVVVSETRDGKSMRWDYVFGVKGEKGFAHDTKWITLDVPHMTMRTHWKHKQETNFRTQGVDSLVQSGFGSFTAWNTENGEIYRVTFEVRSDTLSYLWETSKDGASFSVYSKFEFKRDPSTTATNLISNKE